MSEKLLEFRCPLCPPIVRGALLFKAAGDAVVEIKCPRCGQLAKLKIKPADDDYETAKEMAKAND